ncbi:MAG: hypothetical protein GWO81_05865, partial [Verrucomicrobia bacterium]|nr:hypothetical protein [Verrucomicrobiota bacterium]
GQGYTFFYNNAPLTNPPDDGTDDNYEENDNLFTAYDISSHESVLLSTVDGEPKQRDLDWYKMNSAAGENTVRVNFSLTNPASTGLTAALYDYRGYLKAELGAIQDGSGLSMRTSDASESAYLLVKGTNAGNVYDFSWDSFFLEEGEDIFEENDTLETAYDLRGQENRLLSVIGESATQTDQDWYRIETEAGDAAVQVRASLLDAGSIDVALYEADSTRINSMTVTSNVFQTLEIPADESTTYYILVEGSNEGLQYDMAWGARSSFQDDAYEENDLTTEAYALPSTLNGKLSSIDGLGMLSDSDWYKIDTPDEAYYLTLELSFMHSEGDIDIVAWDQNLNFIAASFGIGDSERVEFAVNNTYLKTIFIWILGNYQGNEYDLEWTYTSISGGDTDSDRISDAWENKFGTSLNTIKAFSDADADNTPAWAEFAFNTDPTKPDAAKGTPFIEDGYACFKFNRNKDAANSGYRYSVSESKDVAFSKMPNQPVLLRVVDKGEYEEVVYRAAQPLSSQPMNFFKVRAQPPE